MPTSHLRRAAAAAAVGAAGALAFASGPAAAQTPCYPPTPGCATTTSQVTSVLPTLVLSDTTLARCQRISATARAFKPGTSGIFTIASAEQQIGTFTVDASGFGRGSVTVPVGISLGTHTVFARGTSANSGPAAPSQAVTVRDGRCPGTGGTGRTGGTAGGRLARTGVFMVPTAIIGLGLVAGGVALKRSSRRGKASTKPA